MKISTEHTREWVEGGEEYFRRLEESIDAAKFEILFVVYIFEPDEVGHRIASALVRASKRGVKVRLIVDAIGSINLSDSFIQTYFSKLDRFQVFRPRSFFAFGLNFFPRLHSKIIVIDREILWIGGLNIIRDHLLGIGKECKHDFAVRLTGPVVEEATLYARWINRSRRLRLKQWMYRQKNLRSIKKESRDAGSSDIEFLVRDNLLQRREIYKSYLRAIRSAEREITIATAYFLPPKSFLTAIKNAAKRGVRVRLLLQGVADVPILKMATRSLYLDLTKSGIEILEHRDYIVHEKVAVVDDSWATIGSHNLDPISVFFNLEANVIFRNAESCRELRAIIEKSMAGQVENLSLQLNREESFYRRAINRLALSLLKLSFSLFTRPNNYN
jgi:cardiolipin synthase